MVKAEDKVKQLRADGHIVWSISRINTYDNCQFEYYNSYILKNKGIQNCYSSPGTFIHGKVEKYYKGDDEVKHTFSNDFDILMAENELLGLDFPSDLIRDNFVKDVKHFTENFSKLDGKFVLEKLIVFQLGEHYIQGYVDAIQVIENEKNNKDVNVIDWKTSSKFSGKKRIEAGRQLLMYKIGLESTTSAKINEVKWCMVKYLYVCYMQKNGKIKRKMCNRGKWVKEMKSTLEKEMLKEGMDDLEVDILIEESLKENSIDNLPSYIKEKYWLEDCYVTYEVNEENIKELKNYVNTTIEEIQSKNKNDETEWKPLDFEKDSFYCNNLCGHRLTCSYRKKYINELNLTKKDTLSDLDDLL
ncbi:PD-(D/E)XK nuclease family protein [Lysinibacillus sp. M3]|uniref:PD-(D/E)XK nuclease family protein n=1 Tax=Lysinibacillus zambalensis TaxID=3160866 RepID=A0ABV1MRI8_9BACI